MEMAFDLSRFSKDIKTARGTETQALFAERLGLSNHSLISLFEEGKRAPSKEVFASYCTITGHKADEYWVPQNDIPSAYLMGKIDPKDKDNLSEALNKIDMLEYLFAQYDRIRK
ncbi:MAG: hypothetical protein M0P01_15320 [Treponema sp.]|nr:hypothetical protein [Treponema sp.]